MGFCISWQRRVAKSKKTGRALQPPFMCDECGFVAVNAFGLRSHKKKHLPKEERPKSYDYAVVKVGRERAARVFDEEETAKEYILKQKNQHLYSVEPRERK